MTFYIQIIIYYIITHYVSSYFSLFFYFLQSALDLFNEMEKNTFLSSSQLDILHDTLQEMDQELVSILNRYREGRKPLPPHSNCTSKSRVSFYLDDVTICFSEIGQRQRISPPTMDNQVSPNTRQSTLVPRGSFPQPSREFDRSVYDSLS